MRCDCEFEHSGITCGHRPGACKNAPVSKITVFGYCQNLCQYCIDMTCNDDILPPSADFRIVEELKD